VKAAAEFFRALADEERLRILSLLLGGSGGVCVCELVDALRLPQYQVSRQLGVLRDAGLVTGEKRGTWVYYRISSILSPLASAALGSVAPHLDSETAREDRKRFERRVVLREDGVCAIGYPPGAPFREIISTAEVAGR